jgi:phosphatidylglycerol:prolipoprotein diacylglycerol transferase
MLTYPDISPVAISLGPVAIHWYGLTYLFGFVAVWVLGRLRARQPGSGWESEEIADMLFYGALGVILGGRVGYMFFYHFDLLLDDPLALFRIWQGGMSFHGGMLGVLLAMWLYGRKTGRSFFQVTDFMAPFVPIGLGAGRIGNFINGELWGRPTDLPWGMVFPFVDNQPRHPSMLYEAFLEGLVLFIILWVYSAKPRPLRAVSGAFLLGYGVFRFGVEFVRQPDAHIGFLAFGWLTEGQLLSAPMILFGIYLLIAAYRSREDGAAQGYPQRPQNKGSQNKGS